MEYAVVYEIDADGTCSAYVPDLPGCIAAGESEAEVRTLMREAIAFHIEGLRLHGDRVPAPVSRTEMMEIAA